MAEKETSLRKIERLTNSQVDIRNVATSAHIHRGKCISGNSRVMLTDGSMMTAREIFEKVSQYGKIKEENEDHTVFIPSGNIEIFSLNKESQKIEKKEIQYVWRLRGGNTIKINLRNGYEIITTPEHKYLVYRDGLVYVEANDIKLGERIVCARKLDVESTLNIKKEILTRLSEKNFYVNLNEDYSNKLNKKIFKYGIKNFKLTIRPKSFYHGIWQNRYNLTDLLEVCRIFDITIEKIYDEIELIFYRTGKQRGQNASPMNLPKNEKEFEELFYMGGLFIGDGSGRKFIAGKEQLAEKVIEICSNLGIKTRRVAREDKTPEIHTDNLSFVMLMNSLFDYPLKKKSHNVKISDFVWKSDNRLVSQLIRGYFDTDGCVEKSRRAVTITSA